MKTRPANVVILAAGMGSRLGMVDPKPLTVLADGHSIMERQLAAVRRAFGTKTRTCVVVGHRYPTILDRHPDPLFVYNPDFDSTNTSKSLLRALRALGRGGTLWMNGDVVFEPEVLGQLGDAIATGQSAVLVNHAGVAEEEVKYTLDGDGFVAALSKTVRGGIGEAVGINYVAPGDRASLVRWLEAVDDDDYFERGMELSIREDRARYVPIVVNDASAIEIDDAADLDDVNLRMFGLGGAR